MLWVKTHFNFRLSRDLVVHLETIANLCATWRQANVFAVLFFELGGITKQ